MNVILAKIEPAISALKNEEGVRSVIADRILAAMKQMEKKNVPAISSKIKFRRGPDDDCADAGDECNQKMKTLEGQLAAAEVLARALSAKGSESGMFWLPSSIAEGIRLCRAAEINVSSYVWEMLLQREVTIALRHRAAHKAVMALSLSKDADQFTLCVFEQDFAVVQQRIVPFAKFKFVFNFI